MLLFLCVLGVLGKYRDQVGENEWTLAHIGRVKDMHPAEQGKFFVVTDRGFLASINARGQVGWRKLVHALDDDVQSSAVGTSVATYTTGLLQLWESQDLVWSKALHLDTFKLVQAKSRSLILVGVSGEEVLILSGETGEQLYSSAVGSISHITIN